MDQTIKVSRPKRNAADTKEKILRAGLSEFASRGYSGARTENIARRARCNIRMLYHYFGGKEKLYIACLEHIYSQIRLEENKLDLHAMSPMAAMRNLLEMTYDFMRRHPDYVRIVTNENTMKGRFFGSIHEDEQKKRPRLLALEKILKRGTEAGVFRNDLNSVQIYVTINALCFYHLSNKYTLSSRTGTDLSSPEWLDERRHHVIELILNYFRPTATQE